MNQYNEFGLKTKRSKFGADRFYLIAFFVAMGVLVFSAGALFTSAGIPPGPQITRAFEGGNAVYSKLFYYDDVFSSDLWHPAQTRDRGVVNYDSMRADNGVTLYTSGHEASAYLISMEGEVLHKWHKPFSAIWNNSAAVKHPQPDSHVYMRKARLYSNGDLLAIYEGVGDTPYGYGLVKLDKNSKVIWSYLQAAHHDFDVAPDGRIFVLTQETVDQTLPQLDHLASPRLEDYLVTLSPSGQELSKVRLLNAVDKSSFRQLLFSISSFALADPLHTNSVHLITEDDAKQFRFGKAGQLLLSFREPSTIAVLDLEQGKLVWALKGYWSGQHDPHILANGNILLFDNLGNFAGPEGRSRALEIDPNDLRIVWQYSGKKSNPLESDIRSYTQRLPNGNTLLTESNGGRILEVTPDQKVVWEYINPVRGGPDNRKIPIICKAQRLPESATAFLQETSPALASK